MDPSPHIMDASVPASPVAVRRNRIPIVIVGILLTLATIIIYIWLTTGTKGQISPTNNGGVVTVVKPAYTLYDSKYIVLKHKNIYSVKHLSTTEPGVEQSRLRADTPYDKTLTISVQPLSQNGIAADSGFVYRRLHPELYQGQRLQVGADQAILWVKSDGTERTIYIPHGNQYAVLSFSLDRTNDVADLPQEVSDVLQSFKWK